MNVKQLNASYEEGSIAVSALRFNGRMAVVPHGNAVNIRVYEIDEGTHLRVNGIDHTLNATFALNFTTGEWALSWDSLYLRRVEVKPNSIYDHDPTPAARAAVCEILSEVVPVWIKHHPERMSASVERMREGFRDKCFSTLTELHAEIARLNQVRMDALTWDAEELASASEKHEQYAHNFSVR